MKWTYKFFGVGSLLFSAISFAGNAQIDITLLCFKATLCKKMEPFDVSKTGCGSTGDDSEVYRVTCQDGRSNFLVYSNDSSTFHFNSNWPWQAWTGQATNNGGQLIHDFCKGAVKNVKPYNQRPADYRKSMTVPPGEFCS